MRTQIIALTQRVVHISNYNETRDCIDHSWISYLESIHKIPLLVPNRITDIDKWIKNFDIGGVILSGGNNLTTCSNSSESSVLRDNLEKKLLCYAINNSIPVLGVCRGMQLINMYFGGTLNQISGHAGNNHFVYSSHTKVKYFPRIDKLWVNSYHNYAIYNTQVGNSLNPVYLDRSGNCEAFEHTDLPIVGLMWHPERGDYVCDYNNQILNKIFGNY